MPNAVVGTLRALLTADTAQYDKALKRSAQATEEFTQETQKLTAQAQRMTTAFQGDKLITHAKNLTAAVKEVGGASRLTDAEQRRVNATLTDAIAKYQALGKTAPAQMVALQRETARTTATTNLMTTAMTRAGAAIATAFSIGAVTGFARGIGQFASQMQNLSAETGVSTTRLQALNFVAAGAGLTIEDLTSAINNLSRRLASGDTSATAAVQRLGFEVNDLLRMKPDEAFIRLGEAIGKLPTAQERTRVAWELLGRAGTRSLRIMNDELGTTIEQVEKTGAVIDEELIQAANDFDNAWAQGWIRFRAGMARAFGDAEAGIRQLRILVNGAAADEAALNAELLTRLQGPRTPGLPQAPGMFRPGAGLRAPGATAADFREIAKAAEELERVIARIAHEQAVKTLFEELSGENAQRAAQQLEQAFLRLTTSQRENAAIVQEVLRRYQELRLKAGTEVAPALESLFRAVGTLAGHTMDLAEAMQALPPAIGPAADSLNAYNLIALAGVEAALAHAAALQAERAELLRLGMIAPDAPDREDVTGEAWRIAITQRREAMEAEMQRVADFLRDVGLQMEHSITNTFGRMLVGLEGFKDGFLNIWRSIQQGLADILGQMVRDFIGGYLRRIAGAAVGGAAAGAAIGGGASFAASSVAGVEAAALGAGAGTGATLAALATNPITIAAAAAVGLGLLIGKKGLFRGGEEGVKVNPRRDQFIAQFGGHHRLAARLTSKGAGPGGGKLMTALNVADTVREFEAAQSAIAGFLGKGVKLFQMGGFVPPGVVQPAILHGGPHGEVIMPVGRSGGAPVIVNINANIRAWDAAGVKQAFRDQIIPETKQALLLNTDGLTTAIQRHALGGRR